MQSKFVTADVSQSDYILALRWSTSEQLGSHKVSSYEQLKRRMRFGNKGLFDIKIWYKNATLQRYLINERRQMKQ